MCSLESRLEIALIDAKVALIMTRWVNLGPGLTPDDILWTAHIDRPKRGERIPEHLITNPRQCFEDIAPQSFRDLKYHNLAYLQNQRYKKVMRRDTSRDLYWVPYKESLKRRVYEFLFHYIYIYTIPSKVLLFL
jgi:hypothetical protein